MLSFNKTQILSETSLSSHFINWRDVFFLRRWIIAIGFSYLLSWYSKQSILLWGRCSFKMRSRIIVQYKTDRLILMQDVYKGKKKQPTSFPLINLSAWNSQILQMNKWVTSNILRMVVIWKIQLNISKWLLERILNAPTQRNNKYAKW